MLSCLQFFSLWLLLKNASLFLFPTHSLFHLAPVSGHGALAEATPPLWAGAMWAPLTLQPSLTPSELFCHLLLTVLLQLPELRTSYLLAFFLLCLPCLSLWSLDSVFQGLGCLWSMINVKILLYAVPPY